MESRLPGQPKEQCLEASDSGGNVVSERDYRTVKRDKEND